MEVHGTGTSLGDPIELSSIDHVYGRNRDQNDPLYISSVKTNVGHLEGAAGIVGLIKATLQLNDKTLYPHLNLDKPTGKFNWQGSGIKVPQEITDWPKRSDKRRIAVSSFGLSGTNAHVVLEEAPAIPEQVNPEYQRPKHLLVLSAKSEKALDAQVDQYINYLDESKEAIGDICYTAGIGRSHFDDRIALTGQTLEDIKEKLKAKDFIQNRIAYQNSPKVAWLFTGQGSQRIKLGLELYQTHPEYSKKRLIIAVST